MSNITGKLQLLAIILFFAGWCIISTRHELKMQARLKNAQEKFEKAEAMHKAAIESIENAIRAKEAIHVEIEQKKNELEVTLDSELDWSGIAVPDDVLERLRVKGDSKAEMLCTSGDASSGCEYSFKGKP